LGNGKTPQYRSIEITKDLGTKWKTEGVNLKPYAAMAGTHATVDCIRKLQELYPDQMKDFAAFKSIKIEMGEAAYHHGGWKATSPLSATGAQMSNAYICATQIVDSQVLPAQFRHDMLERDTIWKLVDVTECAYNPNLSSLSVQRVSIGLENGKTLAVEVQNQRGIDPPLSNDDIVEKYRPLTKGIVTEERVEQIEKIVLNLEKCENIAALDDLLIGMTRNPIE
jgi:aconitate decarboxylase